MLKYALLFGSIAGTVIIAVMALVLATADGDYTMSETLGYIVMVAVLSLVFIGIKRFRDVEQGGTIRFGRALALGAGISAVASLFYVASWEVFLAMTDYAFIEKYGGSLVAAAQDLPRAEREARIADIESSMELYRNPIMRYGISFIEIFPVGLIVALISALLLKNPRIWPARVAA